jgi:ABC-type phosphate transport system substrate-binding protein
MAKRFALLTALLLGAHSGYAADLVVIAHPSAGPMTKDQVADLFLGKGQALTPVDHSDGSPLYAEFYRKAAGRDVAQVKATWARLVFSGKAQAPRQLPDSAAVKRAVAADPKAVGYIEKSAVDSSVKVVLSLD